MEILIGSVVAYAGDLSTASAVKAIIQQGWLPCDGTSYPKQTYPSLALAVGTSFGGTGGANGSFNVPDLRGRFLRGTAYASGLDPDADARQAINPGGATGNAVGSLQTTATALPTAPFSFSTNGAHAHSVSAVPNNNNAYALAGGHYGIWNPGGVTTAAAGLHYHTLSPWDDESRPVNLYVNFLINWGTPQTTPNPNEIPLYGLISPFGFTCQGAGSPVAPWLFCNGGTASRTTYKNLFKAIGTTWGAGDGSTTFGLPNLLGAFVRGVNPSSTSLATAQTDTTRLPNNSAFAANDPPPSATLTPVHTHSIPNVPTDGSYYEIAGSHYAQWSGIPSGSTSTNGDHTHASANGGDHETRPVNVYVDYAVLGDTTTGTFNDYYPVGTVLAYGAPLNQQTLNASNWLYCDGSSVSRTQYASLFKAIGTAYGAGDGVSTFNLPDLIGMFQRGVNGTASGANYDPDSGSRSPPPGVSGGNSGNKIGSYQSGATGTPNTPIDTSQDGQHTHSVGYIPNDSSSSAVGGGYQCIFNSGSVTSGSAGEHTHVVSGGDSETRPYNVSCYFVIKFQ